MAMRAKKVVALRDVTIYDSVTDAAKAVGCSKGAIYKSLRTGVATKGTLWAWADGSGAAAHKNQRSISLWDVPSDEEQRMLLHYFVRIRARARRYYRKHHGHLGKKHLSETCYNLSSQIHYILDGKTRTLADKTWGGFMRSLALAREDMILTGGNESAKDAMSVFTYVREHGDKTAGAEAAGYIQDLLYAEKQIQLIMEGHPYQKPDARVAAELEIVYGIRYAPKNADFTWNALKRLEDAYEKKAARVAELKKQLSDLEAELRATNEGMQKKLSSIIQIAEEGIV